MNPEAGFSVGYLPLSGIHSKNQAWMLKTASWGLTGRPTR